VGHRNASKRQHFNDVAIGQRIPKVPPQRRDDHVIWELAAFEQRRMVPSSHALHATSIPFCNTTRLAVRRQAFTHPDWLFEIKYDGFRSLARVAAGQAELISRRRNVYKSFARALCRFKPHAGGPYSRPRRRDRLSGPEGRPQFYDLLAATSCCSIKKRFTGADA
jgi:hypothetical protein